MAQAVSPWSHTPRRAGFSVRPLYKEFKVDKFGVGQVFSEYLGFRLSVISPPTLHIHSSITDAA